MSKKTKKYVPSIMRETSKSLKWQAVGPLTSQKEAKEHAEILERVLNTPWNQGDDDEEIGPVLESETECIAHPDLSHHYHLHRMLDEANAELTTLHKQYEEALCVIRDLRQKLALAGVEGSPPPGGIGTIPELQQENCALREQLATEHEKYETANTDLTIARAKLAETERQADACMEVVQKTSEIVIAAVEKATRAVPLSFDEAVDWITRLGTERDDFKVQRDKHMLTVKSLAVMLGWSNVPPRKTLEASLRTLKRRAQDLEQTLRSVLREADARIDSKDLEWQAERDRASALIPSTEAE